MTKPDGAATVVRIRVVSKLSLKIVPSDLDNSPSSSNLSPG